MQGCTNFEYDAAKTVLFGHLLYFDFWPVTGLRVHKLYMWKIPMPKIASFFTGISVVVMAVLIGVLDF